MALAQNLKRLTEPSRHLCWPDDNATQRLTSQSYNCVSCPTIHSSRFSLFLNSFLSYLTVTRPCFWGTSSSVPGGVWKYTRGWGVVSGLVTAAMVLCFFRKATYALELADRSYLSEEFKCWTNLLAIVLPWPSIAYLQTVFLRLAVLSP